MTEIYSTPDQQVGYNLSQLPKLSVLELEFHSVSVDEGVFAALYLTEILQTVNMETTLIKTIRIRLYATVAAIASITDAHGLVCLDPRSPLPLALQATPWSPVLDILNRLRSAYGTRSYFIPNGPSNITVNDDGSIHIN